jgi:predicted metal-dependent hydrolase
MIIALGWPVTAPTIRTMTVARYFEVHGEQREEYLGGLSPAELLQLGVDLYNAGHYWNAHEAWEEVWLDSERPLRNFYQGLIQVTAAFVHVTRKEHAGSVRLLDAGIEKLEAYPASYMGLDLARLVDGAKAARRELEELGERRIAEFDRSLIPPIVAGEQAAD